MSTLIESGLTEAYVSPGSKPHNGGEDSYGRFWFACLKTTFHTLHLISSKDKFSTKLTIALDSVSVSGGSTSNTRADPNHFACFVDEADFIHLFWKQEATNSSLTVGQLYHLYGKINNSSGSVTWYPVQGIRNPGSNTAYLGDVIAYKAPDDTSNVLCVFTFCIARPGGSPSTDLLVETSKFSISSPGTYTANIVNSTVDTLTGSAENLHPLLSFRQTAACDEKTPHASAPHIYIATSSPGIGTFFTIGSYGFGSGNVTFTFSAVQIRTRYVSGLIGGYNTWHTLIWDGDQPVWIGLVQNGSTGQMTWNRMSATAASEAASGSLSVDTDLHGGGNAWYNPEEDIWYIVGLYHLTAHDTAVSSFDEGGAGWDVDIFDIESSSQDDNPQCWANKGSEWGYTSVVYVRYTGTDYQIRIDINTSENNHTPAIPSNLQVTSGVTDTTPNFQCDVSDVDLLEQIKARFTIYESDGTTLVDTTDSSFRNGNGSVSKEYPIALDPGVYKVEAKAIDDGGASSIATAQVQFNIQGTYSQDTDVIVNVLESNSIDTDLILNVESSTQLDVDLLVDVATGDTLDTDLVIDIDTGWFSVDETDIDSIWTLVNDAPY